jgi:hypothetical protein
MTLGIPEPGFGIRDSGFEGSGLEGDRRSERAIRMSDNAASSKAYTRGKP